MKPERIILIRHGQSTANADIKVYATMPNHSIPLTQKGIKQSLGMGQKLKEIVKNQTCFFYVSPYVRTIQTYQNVVQAFKNNRIECREEPLIREQCLGNYRTFGELLRISRGSKKYGMFYYRYPGAESCADIFDRVNIFFDTMYRDFQKSNFPQNCFIITHGMAWRLFLMRWYHWSPDRLEELDAPKNCEYYILKRQQNGEYEYIK